ncbi:hypothetical protein OHB14_56120 [Streptomyces sp. NBC_01613]|uniref:HIT family protein n=1 Tax=Streptomyces sp. NBC_01613 TaxID=2975896 RepID=UPI0038684E25
MDIPDFTDDDLARLALSSRLRSLSESLRTAVVAEDRPAAADGGGGLTAELSSLLATEVPLLEEAVARYARSRGEHAQDLPPAQDVDVVGAFHPADPAAEAAAIDAWYALHAQLEPLARVRDPFSRLLSGRSPLPQDCLICRKYAGEPVPPWAGFAKPPGGHVIDDGTWRVGHGPTPYWPAGTLLIESRRHFLDHAGFDAHEAATFGPLVQRLTDPLKEATGAPRIHVFSCMEGTGHFHTWLVPRTEGKQSGRGFVADPGYCTPAEAEDVIRRLRTALDGAVEQR